MRSRTRIRLLTTAGLATATSCALASPFALSIASQWWAADWVKLANIGQAYGAASAVFSALAVAGVAASTAYQAHQLRLARIESFRNAHRGLLLRAMDEPDVLGTAIGARPGPDTREQLFLTAWMGNVAVGFETGVVPEAALRGEVLAELFAQPPARKWWERAAPSFFHSDDRAAARFAAIVEDEYRRVKSATPQFSSTDPPAAPPQSAAPPTERRAGAAELVVVGALGLMAGWVLSQLRNRRNHA
jgi:hypothetical protein